jgi:hypothetical protein
MKTVGLSETSVTFYRTTLPYIQKNTNPEVFYYLKMCSAHGGMRNSTFCDSKHILISVGARFSAPVQTDPGAHPVFYTTGTGLFPGVKRPGHGVNHPPLSSVEVKETVELYLYFPSVSSWQAIY